MATTSTDLSVPARPWQKWHVPGTFASPLVYLRDH